MALPEFLVPKKPGAEDTEVMDLRIDYLDDLYRKDGRDDKNHPHHATYTGLLLQFHPDIPNP